MVPSIQYQQQDNISAYINLYIFDNYFYSHLLEF